MRFQSLRIRMYVGPTAVEHYASRARALGFTDVFEGTEHIHFTTGPREIPQDETDRVCARQSIGAEIYGEPGHTTVWRDVEILRGA